MGCGGTIVSGGGDAQLQQEAGPPSDASQDREAADGAASSDGTAPDVSEDATADVADAAAVEAVPPPPPPGPPSNRFGIGLVGPGNEADLDRVADLVGPGGHVKLIFPGITRDTSGPDPSWTTAIQMAYERDLVPVVRMGLPWGEQAYRNQSDDPAHRSYRSLAAAYRRVVEGLPLREGWPLYVEVHNEPNLCYEWVCRAGESPSGDGWIHYRTMAAEYAAMLRDVADALHAIGDARIRVLNAGMAPGGPERCQCGGDVFEGGVTSEAFLQAMREAVPDVFERIDGFASHSYPSVGKGWGFFAPYEQSGAGLRYFEDELRVVGRSLPVFLTETGWCVAGEPNPCPDRGGSNTREQQADWTVRAWQELWLTHPSLRAVMPFQLRDPGWRQFAWLADDGRPFPVYERTRALRCSRVPGRCP